jgi:hypothetical protein
MIMNDYEKQIRKLLATNSLEAMVNALLSLVDEDVYNDIEKDLSEFGDIRYSLKSFYNTLRNYRYDLNEEVVDKFGRE